jgi:hypothetical protein
VQFSSGAVPGAPGATGGVSVQGGGAGAAALIGLGVAAAIYGAEPNGVRYDTNPFMAVTETARPPALAPGRRVNEQDCSRPIEDPSANLKCR